MAAQGPIEELKGPAGRVFELRVKVVGGNLPGFIDVLQKAGMECHSTDEDVMRVFVPAAVGGARAARPAESSRWPRKEGVQVRHLRPSVPTLEDVFAKAVGEE